MPPIAGEHWKYSSQSEKKVNATFYRVWCKASILVQSEGIRAEKLEEYGVRILTAEEGIWLLGDAEGSSFQSDRKVMLNHILLRCPYATAAVKNSFYRLQYSEDPHPEYNDETGAVTIRTVSRLGSRINTVRVRGGIQYDRRGSSSLSPIPGSVLSLKHQTTTPDIELIIKKSRSTSPASSIASSSGQQQFITIPAKHKAFSRIEKEEFQLQIATAVFSSGLAEQAVEDPEFQQMIQLANPMAPIPNHQQIGGPLLKKLVSI
ncbi:hypothetical protein L873DRAFT_1793094 [Choiromyces venosus 120613-1]|uniref:Uncharacterized protein n=1 Tax=Choiromyces venosus 120613-1 TaxID=1336337 RepID=A0A3N4J7G7_9PEZI|nr:hypothetical protein L873DRAFT_1793094 [Choiromyces venosus 120613-1]